MRSLFVVRYARTAAPYAACWVFFKGLTLTRVCFRTVHQISGRSTEDLGGTVVNDFQTLLEIFIRDGQRAQAFNDFAVGAAGFDDKSATVSSLADGCGGFAIHTIQTLHHAAAFHPKAMAGN